MTVMTPTDNLETRSETGCAPADIAAIEGASSTIRTGILRTGIPKYEHRAANSAETYVRERIARANTASARRFGRPCRIAVALEAAAGIIPGTCYRARPCATAVVPATA